MIQLIVRNKLVVSSIQEKRMVLMVTLATLKEITDLRKVWSHEALNFTPWVAENIELLGDAIGLEILP